MNRCEICGATENLQEHHISYEPEIKQTLCVKCHQEQHPKHGVGPSRGNGCHPLFDELKDEFIRLSSEGMTRKIVVREIGISYMTGYLWDKILGIKRAHQGWKTKQIISKERGHYILKKKRIPQIIKKRVQQTAYIRDKLYKTMIRKDINVKEFVNEAIQEKLKKEYSKDE